MGIKLHLFQLVGIIITLDSTLGTARERPPAPKFGVGLYHTAIVYPTRKDLALIFDRLRRADYPFTGASDHGVSEALYLDDPDGNGVELYWDRPKHLCPKTEDGTLDMYIKALDIRNLLKELEKELILSNVKSRRSKVECQRFLVFSLKGFSKN